MGTFTVTFAPAGAQVACPDDASVLDAALAAGYFPHHSCRRGDCNACEAKVLCGETAYPEGFAPEGVRPGHVLTCQARARSDLTIEASEVSATPGQRVVQSGARVLDVRHASADVTVVRLQLPPASGFAFRAGQYVDVVLRDGARRSYSMANAPEDDGIIEWHVRALPDGRFSNHVYQKLKVRDMLRIEGPFGSFMLQPTQAPIILLASGTGFAPIQAMLRAHGADMAKRGVVLYWGGNRLADLYALDEIETLQQRHPGLRFVPVLSGPDSGWEGRQGFVHEAVAQDFPDLSQHEVYACGNPLMVDAARQVFVHDNGLSEQNFFSDAFVARRTPRPLANVAAALESST
jgi:CDP-4-dehydro-6-deoxyglucose reductase